MSAKDVAGAVGKVAKQLATDLYPSFQAGLNDMHTALKAFPDSMTPSSVLGQAGMPTPGEVDRAQNAEIGFDADMQQSAMDATAKATERGRDIGMDMG